MYLLRNYKYFKTTSLLNDCWWYTLLRFLILVGYGLVYIHIAGVLNAIMIKVPIMGMGPVQEDILGTYGNSPVQ